MNPIYSFRFIRELVKQGIDWNHDTFFNLDGKPVQRRYYASTVVNLPAGVKVIANETVSRHSVQPDTNCIFLTSSGTYLTGVTLRAGGHTSVPSGAAKMAISVWDEYIPTMSIVAKYRCNPLYKDDLSISLEMEPQQRFYRRKLTGRLTFVRDDYDKIMAQPFAHTYHIELKSSIDGGQSWQGLFRGKFVRTDCEIDEDARTVEVLPEVEDEYNDILAGMEREYNLIPLAPHIQQVQFDKRPVVQIYIPGDAIVSCFLAGIAWEQDCMMESNRSELTHKYHFALAKIVRVIDVTASQGAPVSAAGRYIGVLSYTGDPGGQYTITGRLDQAGGEHYITYTHQIGYGPGSLMVMDIMNPSGKEIGKYREIHPDNVEYLEFEFGSRGGRPGKLNGKMEGSDVMARFLCDVETFEGVPTYPIAADDMVDDNRNYRRVVGYGVNSVYISDEFSTSPTEWGMASDGRYYRPPRNIFGIKFYPLARSYWGSTSLWFAFEYATIALEKAGRKTYTMRDAYTLSSCINALLREIAPNIKHEGTVAYSEFLYGSNPIYGGRTDYIIVPKSNILAGEYKSPAVNAQITLQEILGVLRDVYQLYWHIEDGKLRIEHISYYMNGGSYQSRPAIGVDLTQMREAKTGKPWGYASSNYTYNKEDMPERYEYAWSEGSTLPFRGYPIVVKSAFVKEGKIEDVNVAKFAADIDYMLLNPAEFGRDGFAILGAESVGGGLKVAYEEMSIGNEDFIVQNGRLSYFYAQPHYLVYNMPARDLEVNLVPATARSISRQKKQTVTFPVPLDYNPIRLVKTSLGVGNIEKMELNLSSLQAKTTLRYDTE